MIEPEKERTPWKQIGILTIWLTFALPIGLWKLYQDTTLNTATKWRVLIYLCVLPLLAYITYSIWMTSSALQKAIP